MKPFDCPPDEPVIGYQTIKMSVEMVKQFDAMDPQQRRRHTLDAVKRLVIRESQRQPLLIVFEDLHWIDSETQAFLDSLVEACHGRGSLSWSITVPV